MRLLRINQQPYYYALYLETRENRDEEGYLTGEQEAVYSEPVLAYGNISTDVGKNTDLVFGDITDYTRTLATIEKLPEGTWLWIGIEPTESHNYEVIRRGNSLNETVYALREVTIT